MHASACVRGCCRGTRKHSVRRKRKSDMAKTTPAKKWRVLFKRDQVLERHERKKWSREHGHDTYRGSHHESRRMCTGSLPTPTSRSMMLTCTISVDQIVPHQTAALVMKVWWLCARVELKGEPLPLLSLSLPLPLGTLPKLAL